MHANGKNAYVPLLQRAVMPGDGLPQQLMSLLQEGRTYFAPFFVEPRVKQVEVSGALCHIIFSLYIVAYHTRFLNPELSIWMTLP